MAIDLTRAKPFGRKLSADSVLDGPGAEGFTLEEVAEHNQEDDCFIVVNGKVSAFQCERPSIAAAPVTEAAGPTTQPPTAQHRWLLFQYSGTDCTSAAPCMSQ